MKECGIVNRLPRVFDPPILPCLVDRVENMLRCIKSVEFFPRFKIERFPDCP